MSIVFFERKKILFDFTKIRRIRNEKKKKDKKKMPSREEKAFCGAYHPEREEIFPWGRTSDAPCGAAHFTTNQIRI